MQARKNKEHYVEHVLFGVGPEVPSSVSVPSFVQVRKGYPSARLRPKQCEKPTSGIIADVGQEIGICAVHA